MELALARAKVAVTITFLVNGFTVGTFVARIPDFKKALDISNSTLGASLLFISIGVFVALRPAGQNSARYGSKPVILFSSIALALSLPLLGSVFSLYWFWGTCFLFGFTLATQDVSMNSHAVALEQQGAKRLMGFFHAMFSVGTLAGGILGGALSQWKVSLLQQSISLMFLILLVMFGVRPLFLSADADKHPLEKGKKVRHPLIFWILGIFGLCAALTEGAAGDWGGVLARDTFDATPFISTLPYIVFCSAMIIGRFSGDFLAHRFGASRVIMVGGIIAGSGLWSGLLIGGIPALMVAWFLLGIGLSVVIPLMFSAAGTLATKKYVGVIAPSQAVAQVSGVSYFGFVIGPPLIGFMADLFELRWALLLNVVLSYLLIFAARYAREA